MTTSHLRPHNGAPPEEIPPPVDPIKKTPPTENPQPADPVAPPTAPEVPEPKTRPEEFDPFHEGIFPV